MYFTAPLATLEMKILLAVADAYGVLRTSQTPQATSTTEHEACVRAAQILSTVLPGALRRYGVTRAVNHMIPEPYQQLEVKSA